MSSMIEVTEDQFRGSLALPLFGGPRPGLARDFAGSDDLPAGKRTDWRDSGSFCGPTKACLIITTGGARYFLAPDMPIRTHAEAMQQLGNGIETACRKVAAYVREADEQAAASAGLSLEAYRAKARFEEQEARYRLAAQRHEDERRAIEGGSWVRGGPMAPGARTAAMKTIPGNTYK